MADVNITLNVTSGSNNTINVSQGTKTILNEVALQGQQGIQGPAGDGSKSITLKAGDLSGIGGHRVVYVDSNNQLQYATNADVNIANKVIGITLNAGAYLDDIQVQTNGFLTDPSFTFEIDKAIYLSNNGLITQTYSLSFIACKILGYATNNNTMYINIQQSIIL